MVIFLVVVLVLALFHTVDKTDFVLMSLLTLLSVLVWGTLVVVVLTKMEYVVWYLHMSKF